MPHEHEHEPGLSVYVRLLTDEPVGRTTAAAADWTPLRGEWTVEVAASGPDDDGAAGVPASI